jgi:hypothetical protein
MLSPNCTGAHTPSNELIRDISGADQPQMRYLIRNMRPD